MSNPFGSLHGQVDGLLPRFSKDDPALQFRRGIVQVNDCTTRSAEGFKGPHYQCFARLCDNLWHDDPRKNIALDDPPNEVEIGLRR